MRSALILLFCGLVAGAVSSTSACSGDDEAGTLGVGGFGAGSTTGNGDGGDMCPTDTCGGACQADQACCNSICVDLNSDIFNCGQCCKSCPNPHPVCDNGVCVHAECNKATNDCDQTQFCCDQSCCTEGDLCCPNADGSFSCGTPDATGKCPG